MLSPTITIGRGRRRIQHMIANKGDERRQDVKNLKLAVANRELVEHFVRASS